MIRSVAKIHLNQMEHVELGNLDSMRDWGHAKVAYDSFMLFFKRVIPLKELHAML